MEANSRVRRVFMFLCVAMFLYGAACKQVKAQAMELDAKEAERMVDAVLKQSSSRNPSPRVFMAQPKSDKPSLTQILKEVDAKSKSLRWFLGFGSMNRATGETVQSTEREQVIRIIKANEEEIIELDKLFNERKQKNADARKIFKGADLQAKDIERVFMGFPNSQTGNASLPEFDKATLAKMINEYEAVEKKNETALLEKLNEAIDPNQFQLIVERWAAMNTMPITVKFLDLTDEQIKELDAILLTTVPVIDKKVKKALATGQSPTLQLQNDPEYLEARFRPYSVLNPEQFRRAKMWLSEWIGVRSFEERLTKISKGQTTSEQSELKVLGSLYDDGVVWEKSRK